MALVIVGAVVAGFGGGLAAGAMQDGPTGPVGPRGGVGPSGPQGEVANVEELGMCWDIDFGTFSNGTGYVRYASLVVPALSRNGVRSCPTGSFIGVEAVPYGD
jgi:hypothetical protein